MRNGMAVWFEPKGKRREVREGGGGGGGRGGGGGVGGGRGGYKMDLKVRNHIDDIKIPSVNRCIVNLSIMTDVSALFPAFGL